MYQSFSRFIKLSCQRCLISIFKVVGAVLNVLFQDQILGVFSAPPFLATATFPRTCYDRLVKTRATLHDAFLFFDILSKWLHVIHPVKFGAKCPKSELCRVQILHRQNAIAQFRIPDRLRRVNLTFFSLSSWISNRFLSMFFHNPALLSASKYKVS